MANEKRLIDANALMEEAYNSDEKQGNDVWHTGDIEYLVMAQPTVDAVEVVHGRWVWIDDEECGIYRCSCCSCGVGYPTNYCPNCGATMDGGNEDGNSR